MCGGYILMRTTLTFIRYLRRIIFANGVFSGSRNRPTPLTSLYLYCRHMINAVSLSFPITYSYYEPTVLPLKTGARNQPPNRPRPPPGKPTIPNKGPKDRSICSARINTVTYGTIAGQPTPTLYIFSVGVP